MNGSQEFDWLDVRPTQYTGLEQKAEIMRDGGQEGKDRIWWCDGEDVWFRRNKSNPETLKRHDKFTADGDYRYVETQNDVEVWQLQPQSQFASKKQIDIGQMDTYNVRRQAALAACRRDWPAFRDVMTFLRERINAMHGSNVAGAEMQYAEQYMAVICSIEQRDGPAIGEINRELLALADRRGDNGKKLITIGSG